MKCDYFHWKKIEWTQLGEQKNIETIQAIQTIFLPCFAWFCFVLFCFDMSPHYGQRMTIKPFYHHPFCSLFALRTRMLGIKKPWLKIVIQIPQFSTSSINGEQETNDKWCKRLNRSHYPLLIHHQPKPSYINKLYCLKQFTSERCPRKKYFLFELHARKYVYLTCLKIKINFKRTSKFLFLGRCMIFFTFF